MKNLFVPYDLAKKLKEKGFDEPCLALFNKDHEFHLAMEITLRTVKNKSLDTLNAEAISAPLYQQVIDWFRDEKDFQVNITWNKFYQKTPYQWEIRPTWRDQILQPMGRSGMAETYYQSLEQAIEMALKLITV